MSTKKKYYQAQSERDQKLLQQKIDILDRQIDGVVYELYGLGEEKIKIVEK